MTRRHHLPTSWLFTDPRFGDGLWSAIAHLPQCSGIIFRHYGSPDREALAHRTVMAARRLGHLVLVAGDRKLALRVGADGTHMPSWGTAAMGPLTAAAHCRSDIIRARRAGASIVFLSPVFETRSHGSAKPIGPVRFGLLSRGACIAVAALGGMSESRWKRLQPFRPAGYGAIDLWCEA